MKGYLPLLNSEDTFWNVPSESDCIERIKRHNKISKRILITSTIIFPILVPTIFIPNFFVYNLYIFNISRLVFRISKKYLNIMKETDDPHHINNCYVKEFYTESERNKLGLNITELLKI